GSNPPYCTGATGPACDQDVFSWVTVAPDGSIHVAFFNGQHDAAWEPGECCEDQLMAVGSTDGGATWSDPVHVVDLEDGSLDYPNCDLGCTATHLAIPPD